MKGGKKCLKKMKNLHGKRKTNVFEKGKNLPEKGGKFAWKWEKLFGKGKKSARKGKNLPEREKVPEKAANGVLKNYFIPQKFMFCF